MVHISLSLFSFSDATLFQSSDDHHDRISIVKLLSLLKVPLVGFELTLYILLTFTSVYFFNILMRTGYNDSL